jgi:hypothetical protein
MDFKSIAQGLEKVAPYFAKILSNTNPISGIILHALMEIFNVGDVNDLPSKIEADPNAEAKLKKVEMDNRILLAYLNMKDRSDARSREQNIIRLTGKRDWILDVLAIVFVVFFFVLCILNYFYNIKYDGFMVMLMGQVSSGMGLVLAYYFGSSKKN